MFCACCGVKKRLFDMFYSVGDGKIDLCHDCWDVTERLRSDAAGGEWELYELHLYQLKKRAKDPSPAFLPWQSANYPPRA